MLHIAVDVLDGASLEENLRRLIREGSVVIQASSV